MSKLLYGIIFALAFILVSANMGYELIDAVSTWSLPNYMKIFKLFGRRIVQFDMYTVLLTGGIIGVVYYALRWLYQLLFVPMNRVKLLEEVGYIKEIERMSKKDMANLVQKRKNMGKPPPVYPNGWFAVAESRDLKKGDSKSCSVLGLDLAVFRGDDGRAHVIDAYCPHLGANFAAGGRVFDNCIECPFHGWRFSGDDGKCRKIPYSEKIPETARVKAFNTLELNGFIYIWYHAEGIEPTWQPPEIEEITKGKLVFGGRSEHYINAHIEEVPENGADISHLAQVHGPIMAAGVDLRDTYNRIWEFGKHEWAGEWKQLPEGHIGQLNLTHGLKIFGVHIPILDMKVQANQIGPGIVYLTFESPIFGKGCYLQSLAPVEPMKQKIVHQVYMHWSIPMCIRKFFLLGEAIQIERDIMIWNNKTYQSKPVLTGTMEDQMLAKHRRWYKQFYSENSPTLHQSRKDLSW